MRFIKPIENGLYCEINLCISIKEKLVYRVERKFELMGLEVTEINKIDETTSVYSYTQVSAFMQQNGHYIYSSSKYARIAEFFKLIKKCPRMLVNLKEFVMQEHYFKLPVFMKNSTGGTTKVPDDKRTSGIYLVHERESTKLMYLTKTSLIREYNILDNLHGIRPFLHRKDIIIDAQNVAIEQINQFTNSQTIVRAIENDYNISTTPIDETEGFFDSNFTFQLSPSIDCSIDARYEVGICSSGDEPDTSVVKLRSLKVDISKLDKVENNKAGIDELAYNPDTQNKELDSPYF